MDEILWAVMEVARRHMPADGAPALDCDIELSSAGFESLQLVGFILDLEKSLAVQFPADMFDAAIFRNPRTIAGYVRALRDRVA